jgi:thiamine biosynthesis protein ThiS
MTIIINGRTKKFEQSLNLKTLIDQLCKNPQHVIAEVNGLVIKNERWVNCHIKEGDSLELVKIMERCLKERNRLNLMGELGYQKITRIYNQQNFAARINSIISKYVRA